jgi:hypothetical protein
MVQVHVSFQQVHLANIPALRKRKGVIYFSTKGRRPLADLLAGGGENPDLTLISCAHLILDYDGGIMQSQ